MYIFSGITLLKGGFRRDKERNRPAQLSGSPQKID
jgi:hypothetical protein